MQDHKRILPIIILALFLALPAFAQPAGTNAALWDDRGDAAALDLLNGPGGKEHQPGTSFKFIEESKSGTAPKFIVEDENGAKWKVKLGPEVKSEIAATRLVWAAGYFVDEDYYRPQIQVQGMKRLSRGREYVSGEGLVREARLERQGLGKKLKNWNWYQNPFVGTREFNGLRVMMALINNWDLKDINNDILDVDGEPRYEVADLGASLGSTGNIFGRSKGRMKDYEESKFIQKVTSRIRGLRLSYEDSECGQEHSNRRRTLDRQPAQPVHPRADQRLLPRRRLLARRGRGLCQDRGAAHRSADEALPIDATH